MGAVLFPSTLPSPSVVSMTPAERRLLSSVATGMPQARLLQQDFLGYENLQWEFTAAQAAIFEQFWATKLLNGGRWFLASWPRVSAATSGVCRFLLPPRWELIGHEYFRVTVGTELRGAARTPITAALQLGLHFDGDFTDTAVGHSIGPANSWNYGSTAPTFSSTAPKFGSANMFMTPYNYALISDNRGKLIFNIDGEWQISVWLKPTTGAFGYAGGVVFELLAWGYPNGNRMIPLSGAGAPGPHQGQMQLRIQGNSTSCSLQFFYPTFNTTAGLIETGLLKDVVVGVPAALPVDGAWHHVGIVGDATSTRLYLDGVLKQDDGDPVTGPRPAGQRPMWAGTAYSDQRFLIGGAFAGTYSSASPDPYSNFPFGVAIAVPYCGHMDDLEIRNGSGCVTYTGSTITVPTAPFVR